MKDLFELYKLYLFALKTRQEYGEQYGDTDELIKQYEEELQKYGIAVKEENDGRNIKR